MLEFIRAFRLGVINLFGIAVPGFLVLFLPAMGLGLPLVAGAARLGGYSPATAAAVFVENKGVLVAVTIVLSYVAGYILRLISPDQLDKRSAQHAIRVMKEQSSVPKAVDEFAAWPCQDEQTDKYPYLHLREYLTRRGLAYLA